ncbi:MAG: hypothetical protein ACLU3I_15315 [Acutalibacteraceae bacterium]
MQYAKTRPVFEKYKASKYSKKFLAEHEADIELYRAACADFKAILGGAKLPKMDALEGGRPQALGTEKEALRRVPQNQGGYAGGHDHQGQH